MCSVFRFMFFFQAEDGIRDLARSRGLGDVYKRQHWLRWPGTAASTRTVFAIPCSVTTPWLARVSMWTCLLYTSDAADERSSVDLGGRRIIKKKNTTDQ